MKHGYSDTGITAQQKQELAGSAKSFAISGNNLVITKNDATTETVDLSQFATGVIEGGVNTFADLPTASANTGKYYIVNTTTGAIGINRKKSGIYRSDGTNWIRLSANDLKAVNSDKLGGKTADEFATAVDVNQKIADISLYGFDTNPYPTPTILDEAKEQAKAQINKKRLDYLYSKQSKEQWQSDDRFLLIGRNNDALTDEQKEAYNIVVNKTIFNDTVMNEANDRYTLVDAATTINEALQIATDTNFITTWNF